MDTIDKAQQLEQAQRDKAIATAITKSTERGEEFCIDCGVAIAKARREANPHARRCILCQCEYEAYEARQRGK